MELEHKLKKKEDCLLWEPEQVNLLTLQQFNAALQKEDICFLWSTEQVNLLP